MKIETFDLERTQSLWENTVEYNLTETGIHPFTLDELLGKDQLAELNQLRLGYGQTNGSIELRETVSALYPDADRENILITNGSIEANFISIWSFLERGDEIVLMLPNYMQIWGLARSFGINVKEYHLSEKLGWQPDLDQLRQLVTPATKMIIICNPNNPTGSILNAEARKEIIGLADSVGAWVYADEIYRGAELSGVETESFYGQYERVIVAGGLSKAYALPGLRIGWLAGPHEAIAEAWRRRDYTTIATAILSNRIATLALQPEKRLSILKRNRGLLKQNLAALTAWITKHGNLFTLRPPKAGGMAFLRYDLDINSTELVSRLRKEQSTFIVAGDCFGMDHFVRIGIGSEPDYLLEGLKRIDQTLAEITGKAGTE